MTSSIETIKINMVLNDTGTGVFTDHLLLYFVIYPSKAYVGKYNLFWPDVSQTANFVSSFVCDWL